MGENSNSPFVLSRLSTRCLVANKHPPPVFWPTAKEIRLEIRLTHSAEGLPCARS